MNITYTLSGLLSAGLTQSDIAEAIGCSQPTISDMAAGKVGITRPSYKIVSGLEALALKHAVPTDPAVASSPG